MTAVTLRAAETRDAHACGRVIYEAFGTVNERHGVRSRWPSVAFAVRVASDLIANRGIHAVVAQHGREIVGCNFLDERGTVRGVGPTAVSPSAQGAGIGRILMNDVLDRTTEHDVRLLQDAFNAASLSLYTSLGFEVKEPIVLVAGSPACLVTPGSSDLRPVETDDLGACGDLCRLVHGFDRTTELADAIAKPPPNGLMLTREGRVTAYLSGSGAFAHAVAETEDDMCSLILGAAARADGRRLNLLLPLRHASLVRWCLEQRMRVDKTMALMVRGHYQQPTGSWQPSVLY